MLSNFLTNSRNRRRAPPEGLQHPSGTTTTDAAVDEEENVGLHQSTDRRRPRRVRGRREFTETEIADDGSSASRDQGSPTPMPSTSHPVSRRPTNAPRRRDNHSQERRGSTSSPRIPQNPIVTGVAIGDGSAFSAPAVRERYGEEIKRPSSRGSSRARTLYPPPNPDSQSNNLASTSTARSSRRSRSARRTEPTEPPPYEAVEAIRVNISPPEVVRLDSQSGDETGGQEHYSSTSEPDSVLPRPNPPFAYQPSSNWNTNRTVPTDNAHTSGHQARTLRGISPSSWQNRSAAGGQHRNQSPRGQYMTMQPPSETQSEADFYASAVEDLETDFEGSVGEPVAIPLPPRSSASTSSSSRSALSSSAASLAAGTEPASGHALSMSKQRWGLRLQVQQLNRNRHQGDRVVGTGAAMSEGRGSSSDLSLNSQLSSQQQLQQQPTSTLQSSQTANIPALSTMSNAGDASDSRPYHYPHGHPLSPIEEQDYVSPSPHSSRDDERATSIKFRGGSTNVLNSLTIGEMRGRLSNTSSKLDNKEGEVDGGDKASMRTGRSVRTASGGSMSRAGSGGGEPGTNGALHNSLQSSGGPGPSPLGTPNVDSPRPSPFLTRPLNRTVSQTSTKSWTTESVTGQGTPTATPTHSNSAHPSPRIEGMVPAQSVQGRTIVSQLPPSRLGGSFGRIGAEADSSTANISGNGVSTSTLQPSASGNISPPSTTTQATTTIQPPPGAIVNPTMAAPTAHGGGPTIGIGIAEGGKTLGIPKLPSIPTFNDLRFSMLGSGSPRSTSSRRVDRLPVIEDGGSGENYPGSENEHDYEDAEEEEEDEEDEYKRHSLHADSFVTAGDEAGDHRAAAEMELGRIKGNKDVEEGGESFIDNRWERDAGLGTGAPVSSDSPLVLTKSGSGLFSWTPAFWTFWLGFGFPVLWLIGGWHFTNAGEMPPKFTIWEWYFWNRRWRPKRWFRRLRDGLWGCCRGDRRRRRLSQRGSQQRTRKGAGAAVARDSSSDANARAGMVYPSLPRWVAERQSTDDGRMRLNDPKRSLRGIQFGYPFVPRYESGSHQQASINTLRRVVTSPNRLLDQLYGVQLKAVHGRPETGRRMFDPWVQRCRYAFCYALLLLAAGLCTASAYLIVVNTRNVQ